MTALLSPLGQASTDALPERGATPRGRRDMAAGAAVGSVLLVWALPMTHGAGGRDPWLLGLGLLSLLPALLLLRPWRSLPASHVLLSMAPAVAALAVCLSAATGFDGLDETALLAYAGGLYLCVRAWAVDGQRRLLVLVALALVGLEQFSKAYLPWWGNGSVRELMVGTFYWHNQFSAFMLGTGLVAAVLAVRGTGLARRVGWVTAPWALAALLFAGSRAGLATFAVCWTVVVLLSFLDRRGRVASLSLLAVALGLATLLSSPLLMEDAGRFSSTLAAREAEQGVEGNGRARLAYWEAAVRLGVEHPVTGTGFDSFGAASVSLLPERSMLSPYVHNGYLQAFSDGGAVLLGAVVAATGLPLLVAARTLARRRREDDLLGVAVPIALFALVLHSGVDFDWVYPSLAALFAILAAVLPAGPPGRSATRGPGRGRRAGSALLAALVLVVVVAAVPAALRASALRAPQAAVPAWAATVGAVVPLHRPLDLLPATSVCRAELASDSASVRRHGLGCSARFAADDPALVLQRAAAQARNGQVALVLRNAQAVVAEHGSRRPMLRVLHAEVLLRAGRPGAARLTLEDLVTDLRAQGRDDEADGVQRLLAGDSPFARS